MDEALREKIRTAPLHPGCYLYRDAGGTVIYVGKAKHLRKRVQSYFRKDHGRDRKTALLVRTIADVEFIVTENEYEALLLESNLIHAHQPRFNLFLKDDKAFPFLRLSVQEEFPRLSLARRPQPDGSRLFGPFLSAGRARSLADFLRRTFGLRICRRPISGQADKPACLDFHLGRCAAPCAARTCPPDDYRRRADEAVLFLEGKKGELTARLEADMLAAAEKEDFERAALLRDRLAALRELGLHQGVIRDDAAERDAFGLCRSGETVSVQVFHVAGGHVVDRQQFFWDGQPPADSAEFLGEFLRRFYERRPAVPPVLLLPVEPANAGGVALWLSRRRGSAVRLAVPRRGKEKKLVDWANRNARLGLFLKYPAAASADEGVRSLQEALGLASPPRHIEVFDISTFQGRETVASMVCAREGKPVKAEYRRFRVRSSDGMSSDDFAAMREVVGRRYERLLREGAALPDLVVVDGGAGQVSAAREALEALGLGEGPALRGLAKREEEIYRPGEAEPLRLPRSSPALRLLQRLRDEAHRFAVSYHRKRRNMTAYVSVLDGVKHLGPKRKKALLQAFGSAGAIRSASFEDLSRVVGVRLAAAVRARLHPGEALPDHPPDEPEGR